MSTDQNVQALENQGLHVSSWHSRTFLRKKKEKKKKKKTGHSITKPFKCYGFFFNQASNQVCATKRDGVFMLIVNAQPIDEKEQKDKEFKLTCKSKITCCYLLTME